MRQNRYFALAACLAAIASHTGLAETKQEAPAAKLELKAYSIDLEDPKFGGRKEVSVHVEIRNTGDATVILPTKVFTSVMGNAAFVDLSFRGEDLRTQDGFRVVQSVCELCPVELRPREAITLSHTFPKPTPAAVRVSYVVSKDFAERYGLWHGELSGGTIELKR